MIECSIITERSSNNENHRQQEDDGRDKNNSTASSSPSSRIEPLPGADLAPTTATAEMATIPASFLCPITGKIMEDPVRDLCGHTYERRAIVRHLVHRRSRGDGDGAGGCCPISLKPLSVHDLAPNHPLGERIDKWRWQRQYDALNAAARDPWFAKAGPIGGGGDRLGQHQPQQQQQQQQGQRAPSQSKLRESGGDEESQPTTHTAPAISNDTESDEDGDDDDEEEEGAHYRRNRVDWRYWNQKRRERRRRHRYALLSQPQPQPQHPPTALSQSWGEDGGGVDRAATPEPSSKSPPADGGDRAEATQTPGMRLLLLPQELHIWSYAQERSREERRRDARLRRARCLSRFASLGLVLLLLAGAGAGLFLAVNGRWGSGSPRSAAGGDGGGDDELAPQERDEWPQNGTTTDPPLHLTYERHTRASVREERAIS